MKSPDLESALSRERDAAPRQRELKEKLTETSINREQARIRFLMSLRVNYRAGAHDY